MWWTQHVFAKYVISITMFLFYDLLSSLKVTFHKRFLRLHCLHSFMLLFEKCLLHPSYTSATVPGVGASTVKGAHVTPCPHVMAIQGGEADNGHSL